jgi:hypothetical protein
VAARYEDAAHELFALACALGGSVSGERGVGWVKRGALERQWAPAAVSLHEAIKRAFDPKGLLNPGKKVAREPPAVGPPTVGPPTVGPPTVGPPGASAPTAGPGGSPAGHPARRAPL